VISSSETHQARLRDEFVRLTAEIDAIDARCVAEHGRTLGDILRAYRSRAVGLLDFLSHAEADTLIDYLLTQRELAEITEEATA
jgi:hypothetical protein